MTENEFIVALQFLFEKMYVEAQGPDYIKDLVAIALEEFEEEYGPN